ncbi:MAG: hypothetical protein IKA36_06640 [Clostridia bacterium]|nr:hypothetical protein [Clostridia bacterium]
MKKSTIITIFIIYLASIVAVGFFGFKVKTIGEVMYIKTINLDVKCEDESAFVFREKKDKEKKYSKFGYNEYIMFVHFSKAQDIKVEENGEDVDKKQLVFSIIPSVTYLTGESPDAEGDSLVYTIMQEKVKTNKYAEVDKKGTLSVWSNKQSFTIKVAPKTTELYGSVAIIDVYFVKE